MKVFLDNREKVLSHNARFANGEVTFELGMNKFGDLVGGLGFFFFRSMSPRMSNMFCDHSIVEH